MKSIKRGLAISLVCILFLNLLQMNVYAEELENAEEKVYCNATLEDNSALS